MVNIKTTTWNPDTCGCTLRYKWDEDLPENERTSTIDIINKSCPNHSNLLPNVPVTYSCILDENQKKNNSLQFALDAVPSKLADIFTNENGGTYTVLKSGISFNFRFDGTAPNRILYISFNNTSLSQNEKNAIQNKLNEKFGTGIIVIE